MKTVVWHELSESEKEQVLTRPALTSKLDIHGIVTDIVTRIKAEKDKALLEFTAKLDHVEDGKLKLTEQDIADACGRVPEELRRPFSMPTGTSPNSTGPRSPDQFRS